MKALVRAPVRALGFCCCGGGGGSGGGFLLFCCCCFGGGGDGGGGGVVVVACCCCCCCCFVVGVGVVVVLLLKSLRQILSDRFFIRCDRGMLPLLCFLPSKLMGLDLVGCGALFIYHFLYSSIICSRADSLLACRL